MALEEGLQHRRAAGGGYGNRSAGDQWPNGRDEPEGCYCNAGTYPDVDTHRDGERYPSGCNSQAITRGYGHPVGDAYQDAFGHAESHKHAHEHTNTDADRHIDTLSL